jgi:hypothetical protein
MRTAQQMKRTITRVRHQVCRRGAGDLVFDYSSSDNPAVCRRTHLVVFTCWHATSTSLSFKAAFVAQGFLNTRITKGCYMDESTQSPENRRQSAASQNRTAPAAVETGRTGVQPTTHAHGQEGNEKDMGIVERVRERAGAQLATQKDKATDGLGTIAQAFKRTTRELREQRHDTLAEYVERAADELERLSTGIRNRDIGAMFRDAQSMARRQPAIFVGSAFAIGLLGARFLKSSAPDRFPQQPSWQRYGRTDTLPSDVGYSGRPGGRYSQAVPGNLSAGPSTSSDMRSSTTERGGSVGGGSLRPDGGNRGTENL